MRFCIWIWVWSCRWFASICTCPVQILIWFMVHYYELWLQSLVYLPVLCGSDSLVLWYISVFKCKTLSFVPNDRLWSIHAPALFSCDAQTMWNYSAVMRKSSSYKTEHLLSVYQYEFYIRGGFFANVGHLNLRFLAVRAWSIICHCIV